MIDKKSLTLQAHLFEILNNMDSVAFDGRVDNILLHLRRLPLDLVKLLDLNPRNQVNRWS